MTPTTKKHANNNNSDNINSDSNNNKHNNNKDKDIKHNNDNASLRESGVDEQLSVRSPIRPPVFM